MDKQMDQEIKRNEKQFRGKKKEVNQQYDRQEQILSEKHFEELRKLEKAQKTKLSQYEKDFIRKRNKDRRELERELAFETKIFRKNIQKKLQDLTNFTEILSDVDNFVKADTTILDRIKLFSNQHELNQNAYDPRSKAEIKAERQHVEEVIMKRRNELDLDQIEQQMNISNSAMRNVLDQMKEKQVDESKALQKKYLADLWHLKRDRLLMLENVDMDEVRNYFSIKKNYQVLKINTEAKELQSNTLKSLERLAKTHQLELKTLHKLTKSAHTSNKKLNKAISKNLKNSIPSQNTMQTEVPIFASKSVLDLRSDPLLNSSHNINTKHSEDPLSPKRNRAESKVSLFTNNNYSNNQNNLTNNFGDSGNLEKVLNDFDNIFEENLNHISNNNGQERRNNSSLCLRVEKTLDDEIGPPNPLGEVRNFQSRQWAGELQGQYELADKMRQMHLDMAKSLIEDEKKALQHVRDFYIARIRELYDNIETASLIIEQPDHRKSRLRLSDSPPLGDEELDRQSLVSLNNQMDTRRDETHNCHEDEISRNIRISSPLNKSIDNTSKINQNFSPTRYPRPTSDFSSMLSLDQSPEDNNNNNSHRCLINSDKYRPPTYTNSHMSSNMHITPLLTDLSRL